MVGSAVTKGYNSVPHVERVAHLTVNDTNGTSSGIESSGDEMSAEELDIRLQFAMSVSFVAGVIQVFTFTFHVTRHENILYNLCRATSGGYIRCWLL